jgi:hypothetical protein
MASNDGWYHALQLAGCLLIVLAHVIAIAIGHK